MRKKPKTLWSSGDHIVLRQVWSGKVFAAIPVTIVQDSEEQIELYVMPGTSFVRPDCTREEHLRIAARADWDLVQDTWMGQHHLYASVPGQAGSIWTIWASPGWHHKGWKINLETPLQRTAIGFDLTDHVLDVVIDKDLGSWQWKDEEEFTQAVDLDLFTKEKAERIQTEGLRLIQEVMTAKRDQLKEWAVWRPPVNWNIPTLIDDWDVCDL